MMVYFNNYIGLTNQIKTSNYDKRRKNASHRRDFGT